LRIVKSDNHDFPKTGAILLDLQKDGERARCGLLPLDIVFEADGHPIRTVSDMNRARATTTAKEVIARRVWRNGQKLSVTTSRKDLRLSAIDF